MIKDAGMTWRSAHVGGAPFSRESIMKMAKTAEDSARIQQYLDRMKDMPKSLNLKENYQELADATAEGGISYLVCSSIPVSTLDEIKLRWMYSINLARPAKKRVCNLPITTTPASLMRWKVTGRLIISFPIPIKI